MNCAVATTGKQWNTRMLSQIVIWHENLKPCWHELIFLCHSGNWPGVVRSVGCWEQRYSQRLHQRVLLRLTETDHLRALWDGEAQGSSRCSPWTVTAEIYMYSRVSKMPEKSSSSPKEVARFVRYVFFFTTNVAKMVLKVAIGKAASHALFHFLIPQPATPISALIGWTASCISAGLLDIWQYWHQRGLEFTPNECWAYDFLTLLDLTHPNPRGYLFGYQWRSSPLRFLPWLNR